jgi:hypothetical protein
MQRPTLVTALALAACTPTSPAPQPSHSSGDETPVLASEQAPIPGFVVYADGSSDVVALDGTVTHADGYWILDDRDAASTTIVRWLEGDVPDALHCACDAPIEPCLWDGWMRARFDAHGTLVGQSPTADDRRTCGCFRTSEEEAEAAWSEEDEEEDDGCPEPESPGWVSLAGGVLYALGGVYDNDGCTGVHVADSFGRSRALVPGVHPVVSAPSTACFSTVLDAPGDPRAHLSGASCAADDDADESSSDDDAFEEDPCGPCSEQAGDEATAVFVHHGERMDVGTNVSVFWALTYVDAQPLTAENCPSASDPCGDPSAFPGIAESEDWWVATDGSVALVMDGGEAWVWLRGGDRVQVDVSTSDVLGVRFHADVRGLVRAAASEVPQLEGEPPACEDDDEEGEDEEPALAPEDASFTDTHGGRDWGNRCFEHLRAGALDAAEAACARGLAIASDPSVLGALYYNVGRIAEARGDTAAAIQSYERSLAVRPGNRAVTQRLDALR